MSNKQDYKITPITMQTPVSSLISTAISTAVSSPSLTPRSSITTVPLKRLNELLYIEKYYEDIVQSAVFLEAEKYIKKQNNINSCDSFIKTINNSTISQKSTICYINAD